MSVQIAAGNLTRGGGVVELSGGTKYALFLSTSTNLVIYKDIDGTPSQAGTQANSDVASGATEVFAGLAFALDSSDDLHVIATLLRGAGDTTFYRKFDTGTDTWVGAGWTVLDVANGYSNGYGADIAIDSNDYIHVIYSNSDKYHGTGHHVIDYQINDGSWSGSTEVSPVSTTHYSRPQLAIDSADDVHAYYLNFDNWIDHYRKRTSGSWGTDDPGPGANYCQGVQIAVDGTTPKLNRQDTDGDIWEGTDPDTMTDVLYNCWDQAINYVTAITLDGSTRYIFFTNTSRDIQLISNNGGGWTNEGTLQTGTYNYIIAQWSYNNNNQSNELNYIFDNGTNVYWDSFDLGGDLSVSETDGVTVDEIVTVEVPKLGDIVETENVNLGEVVTARVKSFIFELDGITLGEEVTVKLGDLQIDLTDTVELAEIINIVLSNLEISVTDPLTIGEIVNVEIPIEINVSDNINLSELVSVSLPDALQVTITDGLTVSEIVNVSIPGEAALTIEVSDGVTVSEIVAVAPIKIEISKAEGLTLAEIVSIELPDALQVSVLGGLTISEITQVGAIKLEISTTDGVTLGEVVNVTLPDALQIDVSEGVTLGELTSVEIPIRISIVDGINLGEVVNVSLPDALQIAIIEGLTLGEEVNVNIPVEGVLTVNVSDGLTLGELVSISLPDALQILVTDSIEVADIAQVDPLKLEIFETDTVTIADAATVSIPVEGVLYINVTDGIIAADAVTISLPDALQIGVSDGITLADEIDLATLLFIQALDGVEVADASTVSLPDALQVGISDNVTIADAVNIIVFSGGDLSISVTDGFNLGEVIAINIRDAEDLPRKYVKRELRYDKINRLGVPGSRYNRLRRRIKR